MTYRGETEKGLPNARTRDRSSFSKFEQGLFADGELTEGVPEISWEEVDQAIEALVSRFPNNSRVDHDRHDRETGVDLYNLEKKLWLRVARGKVPKSWSSEWQVTQDVETANKRNAQLSNELLDVALLSSFNSARAVALQFRLTDNQIVSSLLMGARKVLREKKRIKSYSPDNYAEMMDRMQSRNGPYSTNMRLVLLMSEFSRLEWSGVEPGESELEREIFSQGVMGVEDSEDPKQDWIHLFGDKWPRVWEDNPDQIRADLEEARRNKAKLSGELQLALMLHDQDDVVDYLWKNQPLDGNLLKMLFDMMPNQQKMEEIFITQLALGVRPEDLFAAYRDSDSNTFHDRSISNKESMGKYNRLENLEWAKTLLRDVRGKGKSKRKWGGEKRKKKWWSRWRGRSEVE